MGETLPQYPTPKCWVVQGMQIFINLPLQLCHIQAWFWPDQWGWQVWRHPKNCKVCSMSHLRLLGFLKLRKVFAIKSKREKYSNCSIVRMYFFPSIKIFSHLPGRGQTGLWPTVANTSSVEQHKMTRRGGKKARWKESFAWVDILLDKVSLLGNRDPHIWNNWLDFPTPLHHIDSFVKDWKQVGTFERGAFLVALCRFQ